MQTFPFFTLLLAMSLATGPLEARQSGSGRDSAVPVLDIDGGCKDVAQMDDNKTINYPRCLVEEQAARAQLQGVWATYTVGQRDQCIHLVTPPALPSYVTLQECLDMARDAEKLSKSGPNTLSGTPGLR